MEIHKIPWFQSAPTRYYNGINDNGETIVGFMIKPNWAWFNYNNITITIPISCWVYHGIYIYIIPISYPHYVYIYIYSYGHLLVITGYFNGIIHSINGVFLVLITGKWP